MFDHLETETAQAILVGDNKPFDATQYDHIQQLQKVTAPEIQAAANLFDPLVDRPASGGAKPLDCLDLVFQVGFLGL